MYSSWDIKCKRQSSLSLWALFSPLTLLTTEKIKILKKWKKTLEILSFYTRVPQIPGIWCMVPEISSATDIIFCYFGLFFCPFTPLPLTKKMRKGKYWYKKIKKASRGIITLYISTINKKNQMMYDSWYGALQTELFLILHQLLHFLPWS